VISFRYHVVSIVAVFLALALGIVVGTTALNGPVTTDLRKQVDSLKTDRGQLAQQVKTLQSQVDNAGQFASTFGAQLVTGALKGKKVLIVGLPGAATGMQDGIAAQITAAGADITGRLQLAPDYIDPARGSSIVTLATGAAHPCWLTLPETSDAGQLGGALLAGVLLGNNPQESESDLRTVLSGFSALHMISSDPKGVEPATTVVVIGNGSNPVGSYAGQSELALVTALQAKGAQVVVAGDTGSATDAGVVALVRSSPAKANVSTIDNANSSFGQVSTVLAVVGIAKSQVGHYGTAKGADALFPAPTS
jgi:hypothetical protein